MGFMDEIRKAGRELKRACKDILSAPFVEEISEAALGMYGAGMAGNCFGSISCLLDGKDVSEYLDPEQYIRTFPLTWGNGEIFDVSVLAGRIFIVTSGGKYLKYVKSHPEKYSGIIRISNDGTVAELLWGFENGGLPSEQLQTHLLCHVSRLTADADSRVVIHGYPTHVLAMDRICGFNEAAMTRTMRKTNAECLKVFPEGIGTVPISCGAGGSFADTAAKMKKYRTVMPHLLGIFVAAKTIEEAFGMLETAEKTARIYLLTYKRTNTEADNDGDLSKLSELLGLKSGDGIFD